MKFDQLIKYNVKGSLHTTIFWKYTELFNILKIFLSVTWWKIFLKYIKRSHFHSKKKILYNE